MKSKSVFVGTSTIVLALLALSASAQEMRMKGDLSETERIEMRERLQNMTPEEREAMREKRGGRGMKGGIPNSGAGGVRGGGEERTIEKRITRAEQALGDKAEKFDGAKEKIENLISKIEEAGIDVTTLEENYETLKGLMSEVVSAYSDYIEELKSLDGSETTLSDEAKTLRSDLRGKIAALKEFYQDTFRGVLRDLVKELKQTETDEV